MGSREEKRDHSQQLAAGDAGSRATEPAADKPLAGRVLLVEDNAANRDLIGAILGEFGVEQEAADSGAEALRLLGERPFDLVLLDIVMPEMNGIATVEKIRALQGAAGAVPVVAMTGNSMQGDRETYIRAGMNGYLAKPIQVRALYDEIARFLSPKEASEGGGGGGLNGDGR